jgi:hypothetical protein
MELYEVQGAESGLCPVEGSVKSMMKTFGFHNKSKLFSGFFCNAVNTEVRYMRNSRLLGE